MSGVAALCFENVDVRIGERDILRDVSLELGAGELVALVGPNGAGKTTLLRVGSRVLHPSGGRVSLAGRPLDAWPRGQLARELAVVPQDVHIAFPFRVGEIVLMGRAPHVGGFGFETPADVACAQQAMEQVGIAALADRPVGELSGGERQLVLMARALAQDPQVLLLDEPTAHLDLRHRIAVAELVREFASRGGSALVVSHDLTLAARSCDRMALLSGGERMACGAPADVLTPALLKRAFGIDAEVQPGPDGAPLVVPRMGRSRSPSAPDSC